MHFLSPRFMLLRCCKPDSLDVLPPRILLSGACRKSFLMNFPDSLGELTLVSKLVYLFALMYLSDFMASLLSKYNFEVVFLDS